MATKKWAAAFKVGTEVLIDTGRFGQSSGVVRVTPRRRLDTYYVDDHGMARFIAEHRLLAAPPLTPPVPSADSALRRKVSKARAAGKLGRKS